MPTWPPGTLGLEDVEVGVVAVLDHATGATGAARTVAALRARAQEPRREVEGERALAHGRRSREQDRVRGVGCEHRVDGTDRGRLADGEEPVHA